MGIVHSRPEVRADRNALEHVLGVGRHSCFWLGCWPQVRFSTLRRDPANRVGKSKIGSAAKTGARQTEYRSNPSSERRFLGQILADRISGGRPPQWTSLELPAETPQWPPPNSASSQECAWQIISSNSEPRAQFSRFVRSKRPGLRFGTKLGATGRLGTLSMHPCEFRRVLHQASCKSEPGAPTPERISQRLWLCTWGRSTAIVRYVAQFVR